MQRALANKTNGIARSNPTALDEKEQRPGNCQDREADHHREGSLCVPMIDFIFHDCS
jgi:hypothetical protein